MPIAWTVDHSRRLLTVKATGSVGVEDFENYMKEVAAAGCVGYRTIFGFQAASFELRLQEVAGLSQRANDRVRNEISDGRMAIVMASDAERDIATYFMQRLGGDGRPCRLFDSMDEARAWFELPPT